jgi:Chaperone of endosialidase
MISGSFNTAVGRGTLYSFTSGNGNIAIGEGAGANLTTGDNNIDIGNFGVAGESHTIRIGAPDCACGPGGSVGGHDRTFIAGIYGQTTESGTTLPVIVDLNGQLATTASSERFKTAIKPMDKSSDVILSLKPVTFHYKNDSENIAQFGLIAEEVAKVNPDLVVRDRNGEIYSVRYEAVNAMLLNEFLKEHRTVQELKSTVASHEATISQQKKEFQAIAAQQQKEIEALTASLKEQASQIQKVSAQIELSKPAPQTVLNEQ